MDRMGTDLDGHCFPGSGNVRVGFRVLWLCGFLNWGLGALGLEFGPRVYRTLAVVKELTGMTLHRTMKCGRLPNIH